MKHIHLGLFIYPGGHHIAGWRHPSTPSHAVTGIDFYVKAAQAAERGKFDLFFVGDALAAREQDGRIIGGGGLNNIDSVSLVSAISSVTQRLGLVATLSTTYNEPFAIAERFASLDHLSGGRAGWNIVTTANDDAAYNFGLKTHMEKTLRYERARAFVNVVTSLWDSWGEEALVLDRQSGCFANATMIQPIEYADAFFNVRGPLDMPRPVQGWPVLVQAGGSPPGRAFAAMIGEVIFTAEGNLDDARRYRETLHGMVGQYGREPSDMKIMPGLSPVLGATEAEAHAKAEELDELVPSEVGIWMLSELMHFRLADLPDGRALPFADIRAEGRVLTPRAVSLIDRAEREGLTIRDCARITARSRSHGSFIGTPEQLVDHMEHWVDTGGCDGFNIMPPYFPHELDLFVDQVVPELQRRGRLRREYEGSTLRDNLGLTRPISRRGQFLGPKDA
jgi:FMN-dependent oxidoreductase (nitrilotriacetate monooxygenase family)